jgi:Domain of unknown function (DUF4159)/Aerotolerance regulator N-terminal
MITIAGIGFLSPLVLFALLGLPVVWYLLRLMPPRPREVIFPALMLLVTPGKGDPPPDKIPLWILLFRLLLAAIIIIGLARPVLNPAADLSNRPLLLIIDNGWETAHDWQQRVAAASELLDQATDRGLPVYIIETAPGAGESTDDAPAPINPLSGEAAREALLALSPQAWSVDHEKLLRRLATLAGGPPMSVVWLADGISHPGTERLLEALQGRGDLSVRLSAEGAAPMALLPLELEGLDITVTAVRPGGGSEASVTAQAIGASGRPVANVTLHFDDKARRASGRISLPAQQRNQIRQIKLIPDTSAAATLLMDASNAHPLVGVASGEIAAETPPLRSSRFYITRALEPYAAIEEDTMDVMLDDGISMLFLSNIGRLPATQETRIARWVEGGGVLVRFAGENMTDDAGDLLPVRLRSGNRAFGGVLTWDQPQSLAPFPDNSPFSGLGLPEEITVTRQLLAVPDPTLRRRTWAALEDGTPLVTGNRRGRGWIILFHTSANTDWSNLVISGLFVEMLKRLLPLSSQAQITTPGSADQMLVPLSLMDGYGQLNPARGDTPAIPARLFTSSKAGSVSPPGFYGNAEQPMALNLVSTNGPVEGSFVFTAQNYPERITGRGFITSGQRPLGPALLYLGLMLALVDWMVSLWLRGLLSPARLLLRGTGTLVLLGILLPAGATTAQEVDPQYAIDATAMTRLAYVKTGDPDRDLIVLEGLRSLGRITRARTSVVLGEPQAVDPDRDTLSLFPLIFWPVTIDAQPLSDAAQQNLSQYLLNGGMVFFDTGIDDPASYSLGFSNPEAEDSLRRLLGSISIPTLAVVDANHVLSKSYYLLNFFPGRISGRALWAEAASSGNEGRVSSLIIGSHDWTSIWAYNPIGPSLTDAPQGGNLQREYALRFGINLIMYALTGTYKNDQLHMDVLINRLRE